MLGGVSEAVPARLLSRTAVLKKARSAWTVVLLLAAGPGLPFAGRRFQARLADGRCLARHAVTNLAPDLDRLLCVLCPEDTALAALLEGGET